MTHIVQKANVANSNTVALGASPTSGNVLIVGICNMTGDNALDLATSWGTLSDDGNGVGWGYRVAGASESTNQVPTTISNGGGGFSMTLWEVYNLPSPPSSAFDISVGNVQGGAVSSFSFNTHPLVTYKANDLALGMAALHAASPSSISITNSGWADQLTTAGTNTHVSADQTISSQGVEITLSAMATVASSAANYAAGGILALYTQPDNPPSGGTTMQTSFT